MKHYYIFSLFFLFSLTVFSQSKGDDQTVFKGPKPNFIDIELQSHNEHIRFGVLDDQQISITELNKNYKVFLEMLKFKNKQVDGWDKPFETMDANLPHYESGSDVGEFNMLLFGIFRNVVSESAIENYFSTNYGRRLTWKGATKFDQERNYRAFTKNNFLDLKNWSQEIISDKTVPAYYVTVDKILSYDSDNGGILLSLGFHNVEDNNRVLPNLISGAFKNKFALSGGFFTSDYTVSSLKGNMVYSTKNNYERTVSMDFLVVFFEIGRDEIDAVIQNKTAYIVRKIKFNDNFTFNIDSPIIEIYSDKALTKKVGELNYNNLIFN